MGRRGVAGQRGTAATSACAHARRALCRLVVAGAFCLVGWAALAVVDADFAAAGERSAGGVKLGGAVSDVVRNTAEGATAGVDAPRPAREDTGSAQRAHTRDRGEGDDAERSATPPTRSERGKQDPETSPDRVAGTVDAAPKAAGDATKDSVEQPADRSGGSAGAVVEEAAAPVVAAVDRVSTPLRPARDAFPEPDESLLPGSGLLPDAGAAQQPDHDGADASASPEEEPIGTPAPAAAVPGGGAEELVHLPRSRGQTQAGSVSDAEHQLTTGGPRGLPEDTPLWPTGTGLPLTANPGTSSSTMSGGLGQGAAASYIQRAGMPNERELLGLVGISDGPNLSNDAMKPPVSPD